MARSLNLSPSDMDALARIIDAEAGNQPAQGKLGVLFTVLNRVASGSFAPSVRGVIEQRNQFEPMIGKKSVTDLPDASPETQSLVSQALAGIATGQLADPTGGATYFQNTAITNARGTNFASSEPTAQIGDHSFYNRYKLNNPITVEPYALTIDGVGDSAAAPTLQVGDATRVAGDASGSAASSFGSSLRDLAYKPAGSKKAPGFFYAGYNRAEAKYEAKADAEAFSRALAASASANPGPADAAAPPTQSFANIASHTGQSPQTQGQYNLVPANKGVDLTDVNPQVLSAANQAASIFGSDLNINSGFRSQAKQDAIRFSGDPNRPTVAKDSNHTHGTGLDISTRGMTTSDKARLVDALASVGFTGFGNYATHIHADFRSSVPSTFGQRANWGGWTNMPEPVMAVLQARGFAPGVTADQIRRG